MKLRPKFYLYAAFGAGVAAIVIYLLVSQPNNKKPAEAMLRPAVTPSQKSEPIDGPSSSRPAEESVKALNAPVPGSPNVAVATTPLPASQTQLAATEENALTETVSSTVAASGVSPSLPAESIATRRMYMAHASLRTPEVANPDSEGNRQILQTMIIKALAPAAKSSITANQKN